MVFALQSADDPESNAILSSCQCRNQTIRCASSIHSNIVRSKSPDLQNIVEDKSFPAFLFDKFDSFGSKPAMIDGITGKQYTYPQLQEMVIKLGSALTKLGFKKGDVCALFCHNIAEYPILYLSVLSLGGICTLISSMATVPELNYQLKDTKAQYIFTVPAFSPTAKEAAKQCGLKEVIVVGEAEGCRPISKLFEDDGKAFPNDVVIDPKEDVAVLPYSSGTTGLPKGVMLTHFNLSVNIQQLVDTPGCYDITSDDNIFGLAPFFHLLGFNIVLGPSLYAGATVISLPQAEPKVVLETLQNFKITKLATVPSLVLFFAKDPIVDSYDISSLNYITCGGAPLSEDVENIFHERHERRRIRINQGYGLTETSPVVTISSTKAWRGGSSGVVVPSTEVKVTDLYTGEAVGANKKGEICIRGPQVMKGYYNNPEATSEAIDSDGWFRSGDIGYYDSDEFFYIVDRYKELIKYKGYQVAPGELEATLIAHPKIQDAAVIGIPDEKCGELPKAFVVAKDVSEEEVYGHMEKNLAPYKKLRGGIEYIDEIPKSASGKILRRVLKERDLSK
ncbi:4-coumarate--CoA ligase-like [Dendronephthya gigantea]|uniref:4-coumarate--CoA ligase-like n=1 Tax=Dendronephthya gigantea TaxID=151771 RepID=UPI00106DACCE|nr:4-coumarate--CoA ligase-like [Dendronephthya gigantea]